jgi:hypothetical protein
MPNTRRKNSRSNQSGGAKKKRSTRKASPWNMFVKKIYMEMKRKNKGAKFGDALKEASRRKSEM